MIDCKLIAFVDRRSHPDQKLSKYVADLHAFITFRLSDLLFVISRREILNESAFRVSVLHKT